MKGLIFIDNCIKEIKDEIVSLIANNISGITVANEWCNKNAYCFNKPLVCVHFKKIEIKPNVLSNFLESTSQDGFANSTLGKNATIFIGLTVTSKLSYFECENICNQLIEGLLFGDTFEADCIDCSEISFNKELKLFQSELCVSLEKILTITKIQKEITSCDLSIEHTKPLTEVNIWA